MVREFVIHTEYDESRCFWWNVVQLGRILLFCVRFGVEVWVMEGCCESIHVQT